MRTISYLTPGLMAIVLTVAFSGTAQAGEGVVRITDMPRAASSHARPVSASAYNSYGSNGYYMGNDYCDNCQYGECDDCDCKRCCLGCYPADAGWGRPMRNPIYRIPVTYLKRWPDSVAGITREGKAPVYPMVYQPTDTTQLGFTYQRVPQWQPNPAMVPPMPWPNQWHSRECGYRGCDGNCSRCRLFGHGSQPVNYNSYNSYEVIETAPAEAPVKSNPGPTEIPPAPPALDKSASRAPALLNSQSL